MTDRDLTVLARMASVKFHARFIDHGTSKEYVVPEQLLDESMSVMRKIILSPNEHNKDRMLDLYVFCEKQADLPGSLYKSDRWSQIQTAVRNYLIHVERFGIEEWERRNTA